ncbi:uncharacterized protein V6R79_019006 [Siganus canaliculatus]
MALRYTASQLLGLRHRTPPSTDLIARLKDLGLLLRRRYIHRGSRCNFFYNFSSANSIPSLWCDRCMDAGSRTSVLRHHNTTRHQILRSVNPLNLRPLPTSNLPFRPRDFNIHVDLPTYPLTPDFLMLLDCFHIAQHVHFPTHKHGHTLDLVCSSSLPITAPRPLPFPLSDHHCILFSIPLPSPHNRQTRSISFRNIKSVDPLLLSQSISSTFPTDSAPSSPEAYAILLNSTLSTSLDALAPLKTATVSFSSSSPWFTPSLRKMKQTGRQLERLSRKSNLTVHAEAYRHHLSSYRDALHAAKASYYSTLIKSSNHCPRTLFSTVKNLLQPPEKHSPASTDLCNSFLHFFNDKISKIKTSLAAPAPPPTISSTPPPPPTTPPPIHHPLTAFSPLKGYGDRAFSRAAPRLWNSLPPSLRDSPSPSLFKTQLKTFLFCQAFNLPHPSP